MSRIANASLERRNAGGPAAHRGAALAVGLLLLSPAGPGSAEVTASATTEVTNVLPTAAEGAPAPATPRLDTLEFLNGDALQGAFQSIETGRGLRWRHPAIKQPIEVSLGSLARVKLQRAEPAPAPPPAARLCSVRLANRDDLLGELVALDGDKLQLATWFAGTLSIPRAMLAGITTGQTNLTAIYEGPNGLEGWTVSRAGAGFRRGGVQDGPGAWRYTHGAFVSAGTGGIGREFKAGPLVNIEFDLAWRGYLQLALNLFSDTLEMYGGNAYLMQLSQGSLFLQRFSRVGDFGAFGSIEVPALATKNKARVSLRANRDLKTLALVVDGALVKQWTDRSDFPPGGHVVFNQLGQGYARVSNIRVSAWDGKFDDLGGAPVRAREDLVRLANQDKVAGTVKAIRDGKLNLATAYATLDVPLERVVAIEFGSESAAPPAPGAGDVRLLFADRGALTLQLERWTPQEVMGRSPAYGPLKLDPAAFSVLQFNLDKPRAGEADSADALEEGPDPRLIVD
jgi:hypothetical protein